MRQLPRALAACVVLLTATPAAAQQGGVQISAAAHTIAGDASRIGTQPIFEPDLGVSWLEPATRFGVFQLEAHGTMRDGRAHLGRARIALRELKRGSVTYSFEAGDTFFSPAAGEFRFRNLYTPTINFSGVSATGSAAGADLAVMIGRATTTRNLFGTDVDTLDQGLFVARGAHALSERLRVTSRASRIRTRDLKQFTFTVADSDQAGGGARFILTPAVELVGNASLVRYRFRDEPDAHLDGSVLAGGSVLLARGWIQLNASRFSAGEMPVLAQPLADRRTLYAAGEYDVFRRVRVFGGWESFEANLDTRVSKRGPTDGGRVIGGIRVPLSAASSASIRIEDGDRRTRFVGAAQTRVSDAGVLSGDVQGTIGPVSAFGRFARRESVESALQAGSYTQRELSALAFVNVTRDVQLFSSLTALRNEWRDGSGHTFWQFGGGAQSRATARGLWLRSEALFSRDADLLNDRTVPQQTFNVGLNGQLARDTSLSFTLYADHLAAMADDINPWFVRSSLRVTRTFATAAAPAPGLLGLAARHGGTGTLAGFVYTDWNGNGLQDPGEPPLENIPIRLLNLGNTSTSRDGQFAFINVPLGLHQVGIDIMSLPVDFDAPHVPHVQVQLGRGETQRLSFGLVPLGSIGGRVLHDVNGNGQADAEDEPVEGAVLSLNGGARSELVRGGRFRFDAVRSGEHTVALLPDSLPEGARIVGEPALAIAIARTSLAPETTFLVRIRTRAEIRRVFPAPPPASLPPRTGAARPAPDREPLPRTRVRSQRSARTDAARRAEPYAIQVAALNDPSRAARLVDQLQARGYSAYLVEPPAAEPNAPFRVRVGFYEDRAAAERDARALEKERGEKLWVVRER